MYFSTTSSVYVYCLSMSLCTAVLAEWGPNRNKFRTFKISFRESKNCPPKLIKKNKKQKNNPRPSFGMYESGQILPQI